MNRSLVRALPRRVLPLMACVAVVALAPLALGYSGGITKDTTGAPPDFLEIGCTACHGEDAPHAEFTATPVGGLTWTITDPEGNPPAGNVYVPEVVYTINITYRETVNAGVGAEGNHAGFSLRASNGPLGAVDGQSQVSADGTQATHVNAQRTAWQVTWTAPAEGVAVFDILVNDVDGNLLPNEDDQVHRAGWYLLDKTHALPGAAAHDEVHFGISLQQYWIGLIGLFGMILVMVAGFGYLKMANRHNTDAKDR